MKKDNTLGKAKIQDKLGKGKKTKIRQGKKTRQGTATRQA